MPRRNDIDVAIADIVGEYSALKKSAKNTSNPKIGMENTDLPTAAKRFEKMSPKERENTMKQIGPEQAMRLARHIQGRKNG